MTEALADTGGGAVRGIISSSSSPKEIKKEYNDLLDDVQKIANKLASIKDHCDDLETRLEPFNSEVERRSGPGLSELIAQRDQKFLDLNVLRSELQKLDDARGVYRGMAYSLSKIRRMVVNSEPLLSTVKVEYIKLKSGRKFLVKNLRQAVRYRNLMAFNSPDWFRRDEGVRSAFVDLLTTDTEMKVLSWYLTIPNPWDLNGRLDQEIQMYIGLYNQASTDALTKVGERFVLAQDVVNINTQILRAQTVESVSPIPLPAICSSNE